MPYTGIKAQDLRNYQTIKTETHHTIRIKSNNGHNLPQ